MAVVARLVAIKANVQLEDLRRLSFRHEVLLGEELVELGDAQLCQRAPAVLMIYGFEME